jgi:antirepressor
MATQLKEERQARQELEHINQANQPKVLFADSVASSKQTILIGDLAKLIKQNGYDIGQNRLFEWLRANGYLISRNGESYNMPTQRAMDLELFEVKERTHLNPDGSVRLTKTTKVTGKGQVYFINKFLQS